MKKLALLLILVSMVAMLSATTIYDIQYTTNEGDGTYPSPMVDQAVTVTAIVTGVGFTSAQSFFISDPEGGAWHGIMVYGADTQPEVGDEVEVSGTVKEYYGYTEIGENPTVSILSSGNTLPAPVEITCSELGEAVEGCLVKLPEVTVAQEQDQYGQWLVTDGNGLAQIDDGFFYLDEVDPPIVITVGETFPFIIGLCDYSYGEFGVNPRTPADLGVTHNDNNIINPIQYVKNYPNPFNPTTTIAFNLAHNSFVTVEVFNLQGKRVKTLINGEKPAGENTVVWDGTNNNGKTVGSGIYLYKIKNGKYTSTKKMILMK